MKRTSAVAVSLLGCGMLGPPGPPALRLPTDARVVAVRADRLLDVASGLIRERVVVLVRDNRIAAVGPADSVTIPPEAVELALPGLTVLPGLIDAHVHLTLPGSADSAAAADLEAGFTTVQDLGAVDTAVFALRRRIERAETLGPRIAAAGMWIGVRGGT